MSHRDTWFASPAILCTESAASVAASGSPYTYTAKSSGTMYVSGGTVSQVQIIRSGATTATGLTSGSFRLRSGDQLRITYVTTPTLAWVPD